MDYAKIDTKEDLSKKCPCTYNGLECSVINYKGNICDCKDYCDVYSKQYSDIRAGRHYFVTISPKPTPDEDDEYKYEKWLCEFIHLLKCSNSFIIVTEFTEKFIMHYHMIIKVNDVIKFKHIVQKFYHQSNIDVKSVPFYGIHYLFKDCNKTSELIDKPVIITHVDLIKIKENKKIKAKFHRKLCDPCDNYLDNKIPSWMLNE